MTESVPAVIIAGAYVIRNRQSPTSVLHIKSPDASHKGTSVQAYQQDEGNLRDQQIWWIEPLPYYDEYDGQDSTKGVVYSITSPGSGKSLEANPQTGWVFANQYRGEPWQRWRFKKITQRGSRMVSYTIVNVMNDKVLDIDGDKPRSGSWVNIQKYSADRRQNLWEFVLPVATFPDGWFQIQNVGSGNLLSHDYEHNPPILIPPHESPIESHYRRQWQFQWTLAHSKCFKSGTAKDRNSWYIINRLTRTPLSPHFGRMAEKDFAGRNDNLAWNLELDRAGNWNITNLKTGGLLLQKNKILRGGVVVGCEVQSFMLDTGRQSWILSAPLFTADNDTRPPDYTSTAA